MKSQGYSFKADLDILDDYLTEPRIVFSFPATVDNALLNCFFSFRKGPLRYLRFSIRSFPYVS